MKKILLTTVALIGLPLAAIAGPFGLPDHQPDGYRDTGCDPAQQVAVEGTNYFNNPTCPDIAGNAGVWNNEFFFPPRERDDDEEEPGDGEEEPGDGDNGEGSDDEEFVGGVGW